jgi:hypothetical protein
VCVQLYPILSAWPKTSLDMSMTLNVGESLAWCLTVQVDILHFCPFESSVVTSLACAFAYKFHEVRRCLIILVLSGIAVLLYLNILFLLMSAYNRA